MPRDRSIRRQVRVTGAVQGVGFRPWIYRLATARGLAGYVLNDTQGVLLEVEGPAQQVEDFLAALEPGGDPQPPPLARITGLKTTRMDPLGEAVFAIRLSKTGAAAATQVSPDMAICGDCLRELLDPADRRYRYPFINCTNCGPRYSIIFDVPYDRPRTTMGVFKMCPDCQREYDDPANRRFHAQPNACPECGPRLALYDAEGNEVATGTAANNAAVAPGRKTPLPLGEGGPSGPGEGKAAGVDPVTFVREKLLAGAIVVLKGLTGYHLACDARNEAAVTELRRRKHRDEKPLALMVASAAWAARVVRLDEAARKLLESPERPIVLIPKLAGSDPDPDEIAPSVAPRSLYLGLMLPYAPLHYLLFADDFPPLVMTSANVSEEPMCRENRETMARMKGIADYYLLHNRDIQTICDDSVTTIQGGEPLVIRRARGYAPRPLALAEPAPARAILAVGPELKNCVALTRGGEVYVSQHIGDLKNPLAVAYFEETINKLERLIEATPALVAHDLHPAYHSTRYARGRTGVRLVPVQHHHAHIASVMAEHRLAEPVLGLAMDGTGYGLDGAVWGGEVLHVRPDGTFVRLGHLHYVALPGGDAAIEKVVRGAYAHLLDAFADAADDVARRVLPTTSPEDRAVWRRMIATGLNSPLACGLGRLFDAASAILGVAARSSYEGQAAIELEAAAADGVSERFSYELVDCQASNCVWHGLPSSRAEAQNGTSTGWGHPVPPGKVRPDSPLVPEVSTQSFVISTAPLIRDLVAAVDAGRPVGESAAKFHNTVAAFLLDGARVGRKIAGLDCVALAGGCFLNRYLVERLAPFLEADGFTVYRHREVSPGDGGIALGQVEVVRQRLAAGTL